MKSLLRLTTSLLIIFLATDCVAQVVGREPILVTLKLSKRERRGSQILVIDATLANQGSKPVTHHDSHGFLIQITDSVGVDVSSQERDYISPTQNTINPLGSSGMIIELQPKAAEEFHLVWRPKSSYRMVGAYNVKVCRWDYNTVGFVCSAPSEIDMTSSVSSRDASNPRETSGLEDHPVA